MTDAVPAARQQLPAVVLQGAAVGYFQLEHRTPAEALRDIAEAYWIVHWDVPAGEERAQDVVTRPCVHLTVERDQTTVTGVVTRCFRRVLVGKGRVVGVRFRPAGFSALWREPLSSLTDQAPPATSVLGAGAGPELEEIAAAEVVDDATRLMDRFLVRRRHARHPGAELVDAAVDQIETDTEVTRVAQVAGHFGVSPRTLQRRFERYLGVGPKWVIQRRRIQDALAQIDQGHDLDWSALAVRLGYADQAHFVNAFTEIVGQPPSRYARGVPRPA